MYFRIYKLQANGQSFDTTYDLIKSMDPSFLNYLNISVKDAYLKNDYSESLITELVQASLRINYGQNINVHQFVGKNLLYLKVFLTVNSGIFILSYQN